MEVLQLEFMENQVIKKDHHHKTIDAHCHLHVQEAADAVAGLFDPFDIPAFRHSNQITTNQNVLQIQDRFMDLTNVETRLKKMDSQGIDMQVLNSSSFSTLL